MPAIITSKFRRNNAQAFSSSFSGSSAMSIILVLVNFLRLVLKIDQMEEQII